MMCGYMILLIVCHAFTLCLSAPVKNLSSQNIPKDLSLNLRKLPMFPRNSMKFIMSPKPPSIAVYGNEPRQKIMPKMSITTQMSPKYNSENYGTKFATRKPLMALRTFTVKPRVNKLLDIAATTTIRDVQNDAIFTAKRVPRNILTDPKNEGKLPDVPKEKHVEVKQALHFRSSNEIDKVRRDERNNGKFLLQDFNEFIFLHKNDQIQLLLDVLNDMVQNFDGDEKITELIMKKPARLKRSKNVIEEENMSTTVSGLRYTGRDTRLNNNLYFKNINS